MKKTNCSTAKLCFAFYLLFSFGSAYSQSSTLGHFVPGFPLVNWCGWDAATRIPFSIEHRGNQRINFSTNGFNRMFIDNGAAGIAAGRIAMGNNLPANFAPQARLHLHHTGGGNTNLLFTNVVTGATLNDGLEIGMTVTGEAYFTNKENGRNFTWYNRGPGLIARMRLYDGGSGQTTGRLAISDNLPNIFVAVDRLTAYETALTGSVQARFQNTNTGVTATDGYAVGVDNANGVVNHTQYETREVRWLSPDIRTGTVKEWLRIQNNTTAVNSCGPTSTDGYLGLNNQVPIFHIDGITPAKCDGELFVGFSPSDIVTSKMGMCNAVIRDSSLLPTFFGNIDASRNYLAIQTVGAITTLSDYTPTQTNPWPVHRFIVGKDWVYNQNGVQDLAEINNRMAFTWQNGSIIKMQMSSSGQTRIGTNLSTFGSPPRNRLEISADAAVDPYGNVMATNGASGVRLSYLTALNTPMTNPGTGVLGVDTAGNIIYVPANAGGTALGNLCTAPTQNGLTGDYEIPLNSHNFYFTGQTNNNDRVAIGMPCGTALNAKLHVFRNSTPIGNNPIAILGHNTEASSVGIFRTIGIYGIADANTLGFRIGVAGLGTNGSENVGGNFEAIRGAGPSNAASYGIRARGLNGLIVAGVYAEAISNDITASATGIEGRATSVVDVNTGGKFSAFNGNINYAVYAESNMSGGTSGPHYAGYFDGDLVYTGNFGMASDANLKTNIDTLQNAISVINQLKPKQFNFDQAGHPSMSLPSGLQYGLIAQELETVLPNLVNNNVHPAKKDTAGNVVVPPVNFKSVEYEQLIPFLIKGMQEQQAQIKKQDSLITALSNQINSCCSNTNTARQSNSTINQLDIELSDKDVIVLNQNVPNPFAEQTTITYNVPASVGKAQLIFFNTNGQVIQTVDIKTRGKGKVNVFASDLSSGLYNYTLVADGKVIDSKKMVRE